MNSFRPLAIVMAAALLFATPVAAQTTVYSTFGPGDSFSLTNATGIGGTTTQWIAAPFTYAGPSGDLLFGVRAAVAGNEAAGANLTVSIWEGATMTSATQLDAWAFLTAIPNPGGILTLHSTLNPALTNGATYWVMLSSPTTSLYNWRRSEYSGLLAYTNSGSGFWYATTASLPTFDVSTMPDIVSDVVPEPATLTLLATGLLGLGAARRKKRQQQG